MKDKQNVDSLKTDVDSLIKSWLWKTSKVLSQEICHLIVCSSKGVDNLCGF